MRMAEPQSREDAAERQRQSRALEMGAHASITSYATATWREGDAMGEEGCHHQPRRHVLPGNAWHGRPEGERLLWAQRWVPRGGTDLGRGRRGVLAL